MPPVCILWWRETASEKRSKSNYSRKQINMFIYRERAGQDSWTVGELSHGSDDNSAHWKRVQPAGKWFWKPIAQSLKKKLLICKTCYHIPGTWYFCRVLALNLHRTPSYVGVAVTAENDTQFFSTCKNKNNSWARTVTKPPRKGNREREIHAHFAEKG